MKYELHLCNNKLFIWVKVKKEPNNTSKPNIRMTLIGSLSVSECQNTAVLKLVFKIKVCQYIWQL